MRALVTGGAGFIGSAIATALIERGDDVRVLDNLIAGSKENIPAGTDFWEADLRDPDALREATRDVEVLTAERARA